MKRQNILLMLLCVICLGAGLFFLATNQVSPVSSNPATPEVLSHEDEIVPLVEVSDSLVDKTVYDDPSELPDATIDEVLADLNELEQINLAYRRQPGWWHIVKRTWRYKDEILQGQDEAALRNTIDNYPPVQIYDRWLQIIDDEGTFGKADLTVSSDEAGKPFLVLVSDEEGNGGNLTDMERDLPVYLETPPEVAEELDALPPKKIESVLRDTIEWLEAMKPTGLDLEIQAGLIRAGGTETYFLSVQTYVQGEPYEMSWLPEPVVGYVLTYRIDPVTGNLIESTESAIGESGTVYLIHTENLLVSELFDEMSEEARQSWTTYMDQYWELLNSQGE